MDLRDTSACTSILTGMIGEWFSDCFKIDNYMGTSFLLTTIEWHVLAAKRIRLKLNEYVLIGNIILTRITK